MRTQDKMIGSPAFLTAYLMLLSTIYNPYGNLFQSIFLVHQDNTKVFFVKIPKTVKMIKDILVFFNINDTWNILLFNASLKIINVFNFSGLSNEALHTILSNDNLKINKGLRNILGIAWGQDNIILDFFKIYDILSLLDIRPSNDPTSLERTLAFLKTVHCLFHYKTHLTVAVSSTQVSLLYGNIDSSVIFLLKPPKSLKTSAKSRECLKNNAYLHLSLKQVFENGKHNNNSDVNRYFMVDDTDEVNDGNTATITFIPVKDLFSKFNVDKEVLKNYNESAFLKTSEHYQAIAFSNIELFVKVMNFDLFEKIERLLDFKLDLSTEALIPDDQFRLLYKDNKDRLRHLSIESYNDMSSLSKALKALSFQAPAKSLFNFFSIKLVGMDRFFNECIQYVKKLGLPPNYMFHNNGIFSLLAIDEDQTKNYLEDKGLVQLNGCTLSNIPIESNSKLDLVLNSYKKLYHQKGIYIKDYVKCVNNLRLNILSPLCTVGSSSSTNHGDVLASKNNELSINRESPMLSTVIINVSQNTPNLSIVNNHGTTTTLAESLAAAASAKSSFNCGTISTTMNQTNSVLSSSAAVSNTSIPPLHIKSPFLACKPSIISNATGVDSLIEAPSTSNIGQQEAVSVTSRSNHDFTYSKINNLDNNIEEMKDNAITVRGIHRQKRASAKLPSDFFVSAEFKRILEKLGKCCSPSYPLLPESWNTWCYSSLHFRNLSVGIPNRVQIVYMAFCYDYLKWKVSTLEVPFYFVNPSKFYFYKLVIAQNKAIIIVINILKEILKKYLELHSANAKTKEQLQVLNFMGLICSDLKIVSHIFSCLVRFLNGISFQNMYNVFETICDDLQLTEVRDYFMLVNFLKDIHGNNINLNVYKKDTDRLTDHSCIDNYIFHLVCRMKSGKLLLPYMKTNVAFATIGLGNIFQQNPDGSVKLNNCELLLLRLKQFCPNKKLHVDFINDEIIDSNTFINIIDTRLAHIGSGHPYQLETGPLSSQKDVTVTLTQATQLASLPRPFTKEKHSDMKNREKNTDIQDHLLIIERSMFPEEKVDNLRSPIKKLKAGVNNPGMSNEVNNDSVYQNTALAQMIKYSSTITNTEVTTKGNIINNDAVNSINCCKEIKNAEKEHSSTVENSTIKDSRSLVPSKRTEDIRTNLNVEIFVNNYKENAESYNNNTGRTVEIKDAASSIVEGETTVFDNGTEDNEADEDVIEDKAARMNNNATAIYKNEINSISFQSNTIDEHQRGMANAANTPSEKSQEFTNIEFDEDIQYASIKNRETKRKQNSTKNSFENIKRPFKTVPVSSKYHDSMQKNPQAFSDLKKLYEIYISAVKKQSSDVKRVKNKHKILKARYENSMRKIKAKIEIERMRHEIEVEKKKFELFELQKNLNALQEKAKFFENE